MSWWLPFVLLHGLLESSANARSVNRTVDDTFGDSVTGVKPVYSPANHWNVGTQCTVCNITPKNVDVNQMLDGSWHSTTYRPGSPAVEATITFTGTAVYVYFIVPNTIPATTTVMNTTFSSTPLRSLMELFSIPRRHVERRVQAACVQQLVAVERTHSITMHASGSSQSLILFDYLTYTAQVADDDAASTTSSDSSTQTSTAPNASSPRP
ncbi:uncharacterized protein BXZ73DRAFT_81622 [Epithele typhae]|uniref:uncharacterized protein n=1 Tax=Epithele typhae TaxID=378194 RepID=UPI002007357C|nr:uncharacterized protein BXZ73DRAFT_81622 [Epithele typhae]KAH9914656.1 hypothetical protein BXZ73DRAFT_81622 [Epithele typhae]